MMYTCFYCRFCGRIDFKSKGEAYHHERKCAEGQIKSELIPILCFNDGKKIIIPLYSKPTTNFNA